MNVSSPHQFEFDGTIGDYIDETFFETDIPFSVFDGEPCLDNDITFDMDKLLKGNDSYIVVETPSSPAVQIFIAVVIGKHVSSARSAA